jgi:Protein of unknown function (DUF2500)
MIATGHTMDFVILGLIIISGSFVLVMVIKNISNLKRKKELPLTASNVIVVAKRIKAKDFSADHRDYTRSFATNYFITFQFLEDNSRQEIRVQARDFGLIAEGDEGTLWHQEGLFNKFERK